MTVPTDHFVTIGQPDPSATAPLPEQPAVPATPPTSRLQPIPAWRLAWILYSDWLIRHWPGLVAGAVLTTLALLAARPAAYTGAQARAVLLTPTPPIRLPTVEVVAQQAPAGPVLPVALIAYDAPGGAPLGALPAGQPYQVLAQADGGAWLQLDAGSGPVWIVVADWGDAPVMRAASLPDLTPPTPVPPPPTPAPAPVIVYAPPAQRQAPPPAGPAELQPQPTEAPAWHPPFVSGYDPAAGSPDCPLILSPERLGACLAGRP